MALSLGYNVFENLLPVARSISLGPERESVMMNQNEGYKFREENDQASVPVVIARKDPLIFHTIKKEKMMDHQSSITHSSSMDHAMETMASLEDISPSEGGADDGEGDALRKGPKPLARRRLLRFVTPCEMYGHSFCDSDGGPNSTIERRIDS